MNRFSMVSKNTIRSILACPLSGQMVTNGVHTPCGHLFDASSLILHLNVHGTCPVCKRFLGMHELVYNPLAAIIINALNLDSDDSSESDAYSSLAEDMDLIDLHESMPVPPRSDIVKLSPPFLAHSSIALSMADFDDDTVDYIGRDRVVDLSEHLFNEQSNNLHLLAVVDRHNLRFISKFIHSVAHLYAVVRKYSYQSRNDSIVGVAKQLALDGYYVYDLFRISEKKGLVQYCLYSLDVLANNQPVVLSKFK